MKEQIEESLVKALGMEKRIIEVVYLHPKCEYNWLALECGVGSQESQAFWNLIMSLRKCGILEIDKTDGSHMEIDFSRERVGDSTYENFKMIE